MVKGKIKFNHQLWRQLGLFYGLCFDPIDVTVLYISKNRENDSTQFTIFLGEHSLQCQRV